MTSSSSGSVRQRIPITLSINERQPAMHVIEDEEKSKQINIEAIAREYYAARELLEETQHEKEKLAVQVATQQQEIVDLRNSNLSQCTRIQELLEKNTTLAGSLLREQSKLNNFQVETSNMKKDKEVAALSLEETRLELEQVHSSYAALEEQLQEAQSCLGELEEQNTKLRIDFHKQLEHNRELIKSYNKINTKLGQQEERNTKLDAEIHQLTMDKADMEDRHATLQRSLDNKDKQMAATTANLRRSLKLSDNEFDKLRIDRDKSMQELGKQQQLLEEKECRVREVTMDNTRLLASVVAFVHKYNDFQTFLSTVNIPPNAIIGASGVPLLQQLGMCGTLSSANTTMHNQLGGEPSPSPFVSTVAGMAAQATGTGGMARDSGASGLVNTITQALSVLPPSMMPAAMHTSAPMAGGQTTQTPQQTPPTQQQQPGNVRCYIPVMEMEHRPTGPGQPGAQQPAAASAQDELNHLVQQNQQLMRCLTASLEEFSKTAQ